MTGSAKPITFLKYRSEIPPLQRWVSLRSTHPTGFRGEAMALQCRECKQRISWTAASNCPFCGAENPLGYSRGTKWFLASVVLILLGGFVVLFLKFAEGIAKIDSLPK
jgi:hypothetical protein